VFQAYFSIMTVGFHGWLTALMTLTPFLCASYPDFVITVLIDPDIFQFSTPGM
jgi:hypothetical protein